MMNKIFKITMSVIILAMLSSTCWSKEAGSKEVGPIKLQSNFIGDKEQPLVSYFIPWKEIGTPDKLQWELDSKYDKTLVLVDRKVMLRLSSMYQTMDLEQVILKQGRLNQDGSNQNKLDQNRLKTDEAQ